MSSVVGAHLNVLLLDHDLQALGVILVGHGIHAVGVGIHRDVEGVLGSVGLVPHQVVDVAHHDGVLGLEPVTIQQVGLDVTVGALPAGIVVGFHPQLQCYHRVGSLHEALHGQSLQGVPLRVSKPQIHLEPDDRLVDGVGADPGKGHVIAVRGEVRLRFRSKKRHGQKHHHHENA